jgi:hypothetical protein
MKLYESPIISIYESASGIITVHIRQSEVSLHHSTTGVAISFKPKSRRFPLMDPRDWEDKK